tara:strand:- start:91 stop:243 length:153 start_codon:yes stop_codon:yes gene_type:complete
LKCFFFLKISEYLFGWKKEVGVYLQPLTKRAGSSLTVMRMGYTAIKAFKN